MRDRAVGPAVRDDRAVDFDVAAVERTEREVARPRALRRDRVADLTHDPGLLHGVEQLPEGDRPELVGAGKREVASRRRIRVLHVEVGVDDRDPLVEHVGELREP